MGISLPFEAGLNPYVTPDLAFEYHYFFTRKYWMLYPCRALIVTPGGFGTMDELFELLTLKQTGKIKVDIPVVLFGKSYWQARADRHGPTGTGRPARAD
jgi:predicted Rossmann-fold nucleotide-binding protein